MGPPGPEGPAGPTLFTASTNAATNTIVLNGVAGTVAALPLSGFSLASPQVNLVGGAISIDLLGASGVQQTLAKAQTFTTIRANARLTVGVNLGTPVTLRATLVKGPLAGPLTAQALTCDLTPSLVPPVAAGATFTCEGTGSVTVNPGEWVALVLSSHSTVALVSAIVSQASISVG